MNGFLEWLDRSCHQESRQHTNVDTNNGSNLLQDKSNKKTTFMIIIVSGNNDFKLASQHQVEQHRDLSVNEPLLA